MKIKKSIAVFLDRDGVLSRTNVINGKSYAPRTISEFKLLPGVKKSVDKLKEVGYLVIVVTNQPDIGNGLINENIVEMMHKKLSKKTNITKIYVCPHKQQENCVCRKPNPGMLLEAAFEFGIDLGKSFMVGDRASDIEAGVKAGCSAIFLNRHYSEPLPQKQICTVSSLLKAVDYILATRLKGKL